VFSLLDVPSAEQASLSANVAVWAPGDKQRSSAAVAVVIPDNMVWLWSAALEPRFTKVQQLGEPFCNISLFGTWITHMLLRIAPYPIKQGIPIPGAALNGPRHNIHDTQPLMSPSMPRHAYHPTISSEPSSLQWTRAAYPYAAAAVPQLPPATAVAAAVARTLAPPPPPPPQLLLLSFNSRRCYCC
jgi:hypothetical protein